MNRIVIIIIISISLNILGYINNLYNDYLIKSTRSNIYSLNILRENKIENIIYEGLSLLLLLWLIILIYLILDLNIKNCKFFSWLHYEKEIELKVYKMESILDWIIVYSNKGITYCYSILWYNYIYIIETNLNIRRLIKFDKLIEKGIEELKVRDVRYRLNRYSLWLNNINTKGYLDYYLVYMFILISLMYILSI